MTWQSGVRACRHRLLGWRDQPVRSRLVTGLVVAAGVLVTFDDIGPLRRLAGTFGASLAWAPLLLCGLLLPRLRARPLPLLLVLLWGAGAVVTALTFLVLPAETRGVNLYGKAFAVGIPIVVFLSVVVVAAKLAAYRPSLVTLFGVVSLSTLVLVAVLDIAGVVPRHDRWLLHGIENLNLRARGGRYEASVLGAGVIVALGTAALRVRRYRSALFVCAGALALGLAVPSRGTLVTGVVFCVATLLAIALHRRFPQPGRTGAGLLGGLLVVLTLVGGFGLPQLVSALRRVGLSYSTSDAVRSVWSDVGLDVAVDHPFGMGFAGPLVWLPHYVVSSMSQYANQFSASDFGELVDQLNADGSYGFSPKTMPGLLGVYFGATGVVALLAMWAVIGTRCVQAWRAGHFLVAPTAVAVCLVAGTYFSSIYAWEQAFVLGALLGAHHLRGGSRPEVAAPRVRDRVSAVLGSVKDRVTSRGPGAVASARSTVTWAGLGLASSQVSRIAIALMLARMLGPARFVPVAAGAVFMTFVALIVDLGLVSAIIQRPSLTRDHLRVAALMSWACGFLLAAATVAACVAGLAGPPGSTTMVLFLFLAAAPLIRSAGLVPQSMLYRNRQQHLVGKAETAVGVIALTAGAAAAYLGLQAFAYVVAVLVTEVALTTCWVLASRPFPAPGWHRPSFRELWSFSSRSFGSDALSVTTRNVDSVMVGWLSGPGQLSLYAVGVRFLVTPVQFLGELIVRVVLPEFSEAQRHGEPVGPALLARTRLTSVAIWPVLSAAFFVLPWALRAVLGPGWTPAVPVAQVLCVVAAVQVSQGFIRPAMLSVGAVGPYFVLTVVVFVASLATYLALARYGAFGVALGYASVALAAAPALAVLGARALHLPVPRILGSLFAGVPFALAVAAPAVLVGLAVADVPRRAPAQAVVAGVLLVGTLAAAYRLGHLAPRATPASGGAARDEQPWVECREPEPPAAQSPTLREQV